MKICLSAICTCLLLISCTFIVSAQQNTVASGGEATGSGGSASYTIGQIDYQTTIDNDGTISEGVQQAFEIFIMTDADDQRIQLEAKIYPNPTMDRLILDVDQSLIQELHYSLLTNRGELVAQHKITSPKEEIHLSAYPEGIYYISVKSGQQLLKTFKIIKKR